MLFVRAIYMSISEYDSLSCLTEIALLNWNDCKKFRRLHNIYGILSRKVNKLGMDSGRTLFFHLAGTKSKLLHRSKQ